MAPGIHELDRAHRFDPDILPREPPTYGRAVKAAG